MSPSPEYCQARASTILKRGDAPRQVGPVQLWGLLPIAVLGRRGLGRQHQAAVDVSSNNHLVFTRAVPLASADGCDLCDRALGTKLEVVGTDHARALPGPPQHVEQPEQAD
jgi:hypothetical protein